MSEGLRTAMQNQLTPTFLSLGHDYALGTLFAASVYQAAQKAGDVEGMQKALIKAYDDSSTATPGLQQFINANLSNPERVTLEALADILLAHISSPNMRQLACSELWQRLDLHPEDRPMPNCPATSGPSTRTICGAFRPYWRRAGGRSTRRCAPPKAANCARGRAAAGARWRGLWIMC